MDKGIERVKSYNNLWDDFISDENIDLAIKNAAKGKKKKRKVRMCLSDPNFHDKIKEYALNFHNKHHEPRVIYDGVQRKKRTIIVPTFEEQVIHHMIVNVLKPIFMKSMYEHAYGSLPKRGVHKAKKYVEKWIATGECTYCLKMDIRKFFDSVPHVVLLRKLKLIIKDYKFYHVLETVIRATEHGIPLGFYTSQWLSHFYLTDLDHYIKEDLRAKYYVRYVDDMVILGDNKDELHEIRCKVDEYLRENLSLELKRNYQVFPISARPLDFMGFRFYTNRTVLRKSLMHKASRKAKRINKNGMTVYTARQMLTYFGWLEHVSCYNFYKKYIKPFVSYKKILTKISTDDRRLNYGELGVV